MKKYFKNLKSKIIIWLLNNFVIEAIENELVKIIVLKEVGKEDFIIEMTVIPVIGSKIQYCDTGHFKVEEITYPKRGSYMWIYGYRIS